MNTKPFNIIFAGTPQFAAVALEALQHSPHQIKAVYTQPDRPAGRGQKVQFSPVKQLALNYDLPVYQPTTLRDEQEQARLASLQADIIVVAAYGLILPKAVLATPALGCLNIHASLLPRWRGAAPIQRAILAGDDTTGIAIMQMAEGLDTGPVLHQVSCAIASDDTSETLHDKLAILGAEALLTTLDLLAQQHAIPKEQDQAQATYAHKITKEEACINWSQPALAIDRQIRAFNPWPVAFATLGDQVVRVWKAEMIDQETTKNPGAILHMDSRGIDVATGKGILRLLQLQFPGGRVLPIVDILNSKRELLAVGKFD